jgi:hypothetical protein
VLDELQIFTVRSMFLCGFAWFRTGFRYWFCVAECGLFLRFLVTDFAGVCLVLVHGSTSIELGRLDEFDAKSNLTQQCHKGGGGFSLNQRGKVSVSKELHEIEGRPAVRHLENHFCTDMKVI